MAIIDNRVSTFLDLNGSFTKGKSHKDHFAFCSGNKDLVRLWFNSGKAQHIRKMPIKFCSEVLYPAYKLESQPGGFQLAIRHPQVSEFRCGFRHSCFAGIVDYLREVEGEYNNLQARYNSLKHKVKELIEDIKKREEMHPILMAHSEIEKELTV
jgi:hypothetical protein